MEVFWYFLGRTGGGSTQYLPMSDKLTLSQFIPGATYCSVCGVICVHTPELSQLWGVMDIGEQG